MSKSHLSILEKNNPPLVNFKVKLDQDQQVLFLEYAVKNSTEKPILLFRHDPPFVRIQSDRQVKFMSLMPELTPWSRPVAPVIPPVIRLDVGETARGEASYKLPLIDTHPYPAGPVTKVPVPTEKGLSNDLHFVIGYFPEEDGNKLFDGPKPGEKTPSYYELKRQFITSAKPLKASCPILRPL